MFSNNIQDKKKYNIIILLLIYIIIELINLKKEIFYFDLYIQINNIKITLIIKLKST